MPDLTPELNLNLALDDDDTADYLTINLSDSLTVLDGLFNSSTGHAHNGSHQGGALEFLDLTVGEDLTVVGQTTLQGPLLAQSNMHVIGLSTLDGAVTMGSTLNVAGATTLAAASATSLTVSGSIGVTLDLTVGRNSNIAGNLTVGTLNVNSSASINAATLANPTINGTVGGSATFSQGPNTTDWHRNATIGTGIFNTPANQGIAFDASGAYLYPSSDRIVGATMTQTLSNKAVINMKAIGPSGNFAVNANDLTNYVHAFVGSGALTLPNASAAYVGVFRAVKAWGGNITINCGTQMAAPGAQGAVTTSFVLQNGDSVTFWCDGTTWWGL